MNTTQSIEIGDFLTVAEEPCFDLTIAESNKFNEWDMNALIDFIRDSHLDTRENIIEIYDLARKACVKHSGKYPELSMIPAALFLFFDDLLVHIKREEQILFPNIIQLISNATHAGTSTYTTFGLIKELALAMQRDHQKAVKDLKFFRQLTNNYTIPADACGSHKRLFERMKAFENELILHIYLENNVLFPRAIKLDEESIGKEEK